MKRFALPAIAVATLFGAAVLAAPKEYGGRPLAAPVRALIFQKACDLPNAEAECGAAPCLLKRSDGTLFRPQSAPWQDLAMFEWPASSTTFGPAMVESKVIASQDDLGSGLRTALELLSGLPLQAPGASGPVVTINPALVDWVGRELLPQPSAPMCGATAADLYAQAFRQPTRVAAEVYSQLQQKGLLRGVTVEKLARSFDSQQGLYADACHAIAKRTKVPDEEWPRAASCWWWLRRAATGTAEPVADLLGEVLRRYDGDTWKKLSRTFPKPRPAAPVGP